ncbi:MAG: sigma-70 family RNA polymerase sigma factor [Candidatus Absconditabacteria bacterium]
MGIRFEKEFITKLKAQDHNAFNRFYLETVDMLFRYIQANYFLSHEDAQDIISDFYVKFRESVKNFREDESFSGYFWVIFKNLVKDHFKKNNDTPFTELENEEEGLSFDETLADEENIHLLMDQQFQFEKIQEAMKELDDGSKDIIYWKFVEEKSNEEIQILLSISNDNVRQRLSRAVKLLKQILEQQL